MMSHLSHAAKTVLAIVAAAVPAILADPSFRHYIAQHPWAATYLPLVAGAVAAAWKMLERKPGP